MLHAVAGADRRAVAGRVSQRQGSSAGERPTEYTAVARTSSSLTVAVPKEDNSALSCVYGMPSRVPMARDGPHRPAVGKVLHPERNLLALLVNSESSVSVTSDS